MKQTITLFLAFIFIATVSYSQKKNRADRFLSAKKSEVLAIHFSLSDFNSAKDYKFKSFPQSSFNDLVPGLGISYWKGLNKYIDLAIRLNGISEVKDKDLNKSADLSGELEPTLNFRPWADNHLFAPFLTVGIGGGYYPRSFGAYVPVGLGLQTNFNSECYVLLQALYKKTLTENVVGDNFFYSLGVGGRIGGDRVEKAAPVPVIPAVVIKDKDNDGVEDSKDSCPDIPGLASLNGCPDSDGDGITDIADKCPNVKGLAKYFGCPVPDSDGDGIDDEADKCPNVKGLSRYQGCPIPDSDGDGVNDEEDKCPHEAGIASNYGCPEIKAEIINKVNLAAKNIFFATGSSKLLAKSNKPLNEVVKILKENPTYKVNIEGHTDNTGKADKNQALSESRANAVKAYMISQGIEESRLQAKGFGQDKPVADNKTIAGRALNRRVELNVKNY